MNRSRIYAAWRSALCAAIIGIPMAILRPTGATAADAVLDDFQGQVPNQNRFEGWWFFWDDNKEGGNSKVMSGRDTMENGIRSVAFAGNYGSPDGVAGNDAAKFQARFGTVQPTSGGWAYSNMVGMGTTMTIGQNPTNLSGATAMTFRAWTNAPIWVRISVSSKKSDGTSISFSVSKQISSVNVWGDVRVLFSELKSSNAADAIDLSSIGMIQWIVWKTDQISGLNEFTLWVDDVRFENYTWIPASSCGACRVPPGNPPLGSVLAGDFNGADALKLLFLNAWWYIYDDKEKGGTSVFTNGATYGTDGKPVIALEAGTGFPAGDPANKALSLEWKWGKAFPENGVTAAPYVGLGMSGATVLDASPTGYGYTGIYFDYKTTGMQKCNVRFSALPKDPAYPLSYSIDLPATNGEWSGAQIYWEDLSVSGSGLASTPCSLQAFNASAFKNFSMWIPGTPEMTGGLAIDNASFMTTARPASRVRRNPSFLCQAQSPVSAQKVVTCKNARLSVIGSHANLVVPVSVTSGIFELVGLDGTVVYRGTVRPRNGVYKADLHMLNRSGSGVYLAKFRSHQAGISVNLVSHGVIF